MTSKPFNLNLSFSVKQLGAPIPEPFKYWCKKHGFNPQDMLFGRTPNNGTGSCYICATSDITDPCIFKLWAKTKDNYHYAVCWNCINKDIYK